MAEKSETNAPFNRTVGIEIIRAEDGSATGQLSLRPEHSMRPDGITAHGGVVFTLADAVGAAAVNSVGEAPSPTIDIRIDFLSRATSNLTATAKIDRRSSDVAFTSIDVTDEDSRMVAKADGVYKR